LLELLAARGSVYRVLTTAILNPERETSLDEVLAALKPPAQKFQAELRSGGGAEVIDLSLNGVRVTLLPTPSKCAERSPDPREAAIFQELAERVFGRLRHDVLLTYGGHPARLELIRRARQGGIAVVFHLHNFGYSEPKGSDSKNDRRALAEVSALIFPSAYSRRHHARLKGLDGPVIPDRFLSTTLSPRTPSRNMSRSSTPRPPYASGVAQGSPPRSAAIDPTFGF
jgi:hypothetical protein